MVASSSSGIRLGLAVALAAACGCVEFIAAPPAMSRPVMSAAPDTRAHLSLFTRSDDCVACHNQLVAPSGQDVSIGAAWSATMMANSGRDPYWQASVRREALDHPRRSAEIQDECAGCHMPMSTRVTRAAGGTGAVFAHLPVAQPHPGALARLGADGVSCTVCHQIAPVGLGTRPSFNAGFTMVPTRPGEPRPLFGPYTVDAGRRRIMHSVTGFVQTEGAHLRQSELCATCHTLITDAYGPDGSVVGSLPEQMNYQEWLHSDFPQESRSCQSCHMVRVPGPVRVSSVLGDLRDGLSQHVFVGGNSFMLGLLDRHRGDLGVEAPHEAFAVTMAATDRQLREQTASVTISAPERSPEGLVFDVDVKNLTGHKFPTGYPARRAWLHVTVRGAGGRVVFESGAITPEGAIGGNDADVDAGRYEAHHARISSPEDVQIYESVMGDSNGRPTTGLLTATQYLKDNRLLPRGFDKSTAETGVAVHGGALADPDFVGGSDRVRFVVAAAQQDGPFSVSVELRYQAVGFRWARNLESYPAPEPARFSTYYREAAPGSSVLVAHVER